MSGHRSEGFPRTAYFVPGRVGMGVGGGFRVVGVGDVAIFNVFPGKYSLESIPRKVFLGNYSPESIRQNAFPENVFPLTPIAKGGAYVIPPWRTSAWNDWTG